MNRILIIAPDISVKGGISTVLKGYINSDLSIKNELILVSSHIDGRKITKLFKAVDGMFRAVYHLTFSNIALVHLHGGDIVSCKRKYIFYKLSTLFRKKIIYHSHSASFMEQYNNASFFWRKRIRELFEKVNIVVCLSDSWSNAIREIAPNARIRVIKNFVSLPNVTPRSNTNEVINLAFLGLIGVRKGIFDLLETVKRLNDECIKCRINIGGNGDINKLIDEIDRLCINDKVNYIGWISDDQRDTLLRNTDIFVLPSYGEGMPMAILEAMSYSLPVVSTSVGGIPELVIDGETGFLNKPGDNDNLYRSLKLLILNPQMRRSFGEKGRYVIETQFNAKRKIRELENLYNKLADAR